MTFSRFCILQSTIFSSAGFCARTETLMICADILAAIWLAVSLFSHMEEAAK